MRHGQAAAVCVGIQPKPYRFPKIPFPTVTVIIAHRASPCPVARISAPTSPSPKPPRATCPRCGPQLCPLSSTRSKTISRCASACARTRSWVSGHIHGGHDRWHIRECARSATQHSAFVCLSVCLCPNAAHTHTRIPAGHTAAHMRALADGLHRGLSWEQAFEGANAHAGV